jgi:fucose permease
VLLLAFILFLESGNEACIGGWTSTFVNTIGYSARTATLVLASYWAALMVSRMVAARVLQRIGKSQLVLIIALISLAGCAVLLATRSLILLFAGTVLIGLSYGPIFPTALAIAGDRYSERAGTVFGLLFSIALMGGMLFPWSVGEISQRLSVHAGMIVPLLGAVGIILLSAIVFMRDRNAELMSKTGEVRSSMLR